jgi:hypothetical protein
MGTETDELYPGYPRKKSIFATESLLDPFQEPNLYSPKAATKVNNKKMNNKLLPSKSGDDRPIFPHPDPLNLSATACKNHHKHIQDLDDSDCLDPCCTIKDYISLLLLHSFFGSLFKTRYLNELTKTSHMLTIQEILLTTFSDNFIPKLLEIAQRQIFCDEDDLIDNETFETFLKGGNFDLYEYIRDKTSISKA